MYKQYRQASSLNEDETGCTTKLHAQVHLLIVETNFLLIGSMSKHLR